MKNLTQHKQNILSSFVALILLSLVMFFVIIGASESLKSNWKIYLLLGVGLVQVAVVLYLGLSSLKVVNFFIDTEDKKRAAQIDEVEVLEQIVEEKAREADDLSFNFSALAESLNPKKGWEVFAESLLSGLAKQIEIVTGVCFKLDSDQETFVPVATYAYFSDHAPTSFKQGEGLAGQVVKNQKAMVIEEIPENYIQVVSGLGKDSPSYLLFLPVFKNDKVTALIEIATFQKINSGIVRKAEEIGKFIGEKSPDL